MTRRTRQLVGIGILLLIFACGRQKKEQPREPAASAGAKSSSAPLSRRPLEPTRLARFSVSAYSTALALDDDAAYLLTERAAYRLVPGQALQGIELELGIGAALMRSAFVFWSKGAIWRAPKVGGVVESIAKLPHQPQYFVASGDDFAWVDSSEDGLYTIQTLEGRKPRVLVASRGELSGLTMLGRSVYFVERPTEGSWRVGVVAAGGGDARYGSEKKGRRPAMLVSAEELYYYDLDASGIQSLALDLSRERSLLKNAVCSPVSVARAIYCGSVEGLFAVAKDSHEPRVLSYGRPGSITSIAANSKMVVWTVDIGANELAVDMLPIEDR